MNRFFWFVWTFLLMTFWRPAIADAPLLMLSTQLVPIEEARRFKEQVLPRFESHPVTFQPADLTAFLSRLTEKSPGTPGDVDLAAGLVVEELLDLAARERLMPVPELEPLLRERKIPEEILHETRPDPDKPRTVVPWLQATYLMVARKQALEYLPPGADPMDLTHEDLYQWAERLHRSTGGPKVGLPAGEKGLLLIMLPGGFLSSFTGGVINGFAGPEAEAAWAFLRQFWSHVHPASTTFNFMQDHLLAGDVWLAMDHTARLIEVFRRQPDDFIALPIPRGPKGRFSRLTTSGLAIPKNAPSPRAARALIDFLIHPNTQAQLLREEGFLPVTPIRDHHAPGLIQLVETARRQNQDPKTRRVHQPRGLGNQEAAFNMVFITTFSRIILRNRPIPEVLQAQGAELETIYQSTQAPCVPPDREGEQPCRITP